MYSLRDKYNMFVWLYKLRVIIDSWHRVSKERAKQPLTDVYKV